MLNEPKEPMTIIDIVPPLSFFRFGNALAANAGGSAAAIFGSNRPEINRSYLQNEPVSFRPILNQARNDLAVLAGEETSKPPIVDAPEGSENRLSWFFKNWYVGMFALLLIGIGAYAFVQSQAGNLTGQVVKGAIGGVTGDK